MSVVGHVESVWRYPVKSMRGEKVASAFVGFAGVYGDRTLRLPELCGRSGNSFLTAREQTQMLLHQPQFRHAEKALQPPNLAEAEHLAPGLTPVYPSSDDLVVDIVTPDGAVVAIDSPALRECLGKTEGAGELALLRSDRAMTDCRPVALISTQTLGALSREVGKALDQRRFQANLYVDLGAAAGSAEDAFVGLRLRIGSKAVIAVLERDPRCKMINLDPDTRQPREGCARRNRNGGQDE